MSKFSFLLKNVGTGSSDGWMQAAIETITLSTSSLDQPFYQMRAAASLFFRKLFHCKPSLQLRNVRRLNNVKMWDCVRNVKLYTNVNCTA